MIDIIGDFKDYLAMPDTAICITTNGDVTKDGRCVMGAGTAKVARDMFPGCDKSLGTLIKEKGNIVQPFWINPVLIAFPTKHSAWDATSDIELIKKSAIRLNQWAMNTSFKQIILPKPGVTNGQLLWADVKEQLEKIILSSKIIVIGLN